MNREKSSNNQDLSTYIRPVPQFVLEREHLATGSGMIDHAHEEFKGRALRDYMQMVIKYRWLISSISGLAIVLSLLYSFLATPQFTATSTIKVNTYAPLLPGANMEGILSNQTRDQDYLNTQVQLLNGYTLADKVLTDPTIGEELKNYLERDTGVFSFTNPFRRLLTSQTTSSEQRSDSNYTFPIATLEKYLDLVSINRIRNTTLVKISVVTASPELSAKIANAHAESFIELTRHDRQKSSVDNLVFLQTQSEELAGKVAQSERNLAKYAEENAIVSLNKDENIVVKRMSELNELLTKATARRIESETKYNEAKGTAGLESNAYDDTSTGISRNALKEAEAEYARLSEKFTPNYPKMAELRARMDTLKQSLKQQREQAVKGIEAVFKADKEAEEQLQQELETQKSRAFELSRRQVQYNIMKREYDSLVDLQQAVLRQLKESQISSQNSGSNILIADHAAVPKQRSSPKRMVNLFLACLLGPLAGFIVAFIAESLDNTVKTPEQAQRALGVPTLGVVPMFALDYDPLGSQSGKRDRSSSDDERNDSLQLVTSEGSLPSAAAATVPALQDDHNLVLLSAPRSMASEAYRTIRTAILLSSADNPPRVILITSGQKSEGKTTLVTNLAVTIAQSGSSVLLIDSDLRRPAVHKQFNYDSSSAGLVNYLTGQEDLEKVIMRTSVPGLSVITAGPIPPNPSELLGSKKMSMLLEQLANRFDYVFVDAPPILPVTDAVVLSRSVDGVVLVVRGQETQTQVAREAVHKLRQVGARLLGTVLNDVDLRSGDYYYYRRGYYSYYREEEPSGRRKRRAAG